MNGIHPNQASANLAGSVQKDYEKSHDGMEWDIPDESLDLELEAVDQVQVEFYENTV